VAFVQSGDMHIVKQKGKIAELEKAIAESGNVMQAMTGIAHTRWATHGEPNQVNAHPHCDGSGKLAMVHNGIIENFESLRRELKDKGHTFTSETDTEVLLRLISEELNGTNSVEKAISAALQQAQGAYAIALVHADRPGEIWAARKHSPLVMGLGTGENFLASDIPAFLPYTRDVVFIEDGELVHISANSWEIMDAVSLEPVEKEVHTITWDVQAAQKGGYKHFMLKEIFEQPRVIRDCLTGRIDAENKTVQLPELDGLDTPQRVVIVACGTSYHAGLWGKYLFETWARVPCEVDIASEFRYRDPILRKGDLVVSISQSGETADTLAGMRLAREQGIPVLGLCNVVGSTVSRESDAVLYTQAGPEISVASTKAMCSQLTVLLTLALYWGKKSGSINGQLMQQAVDGLHNLPDALDDALPAMRETARKICRKYADSNSFLYLGRGANYPLAMEGALKLKEISYIHAEGYAAGEMKHGPIALIDPHFPSFAIALDDDLFPKVKSNLIEVQARSGKIVALTNSGLDLDVDDAWVLPRAWGPLSAFMVLPALQLFAYETADYLGKDVDQPRNLAKSVTVE
jgi:glucosamine--fructose-6-phosphate aminotransferase (isomerizing)